MDTQLPRARVLPWILAVGVLIGAAGSSVAGARPPARAAKGSQEEFVARRLLRRAQDLLLAKETERGVKMLEAIIEQYQTSPVRYEAYLALGKHYLEAGDYPRAINYLRHLNELKKPDKEPTGRALDLYLEGLYQTGAAYFRMRQFANAFPILRKITNNYPNTVWANQSYYYIGMCHFVQGNWNKAIEALSLVGTFIDPDSPSVRYAEAGRRFYVKVQDADLPVLHRLGKKVAVEMATARGDKETVDCSPLAGNADIFIGSIPTRVGKPTPGNGVIEVVGGDSLTTRYLDDNTKDGEKNVAREKKVEVVSTATLRFTLGTYQARASAAFLGQPLFVLLRDVDLDTTDRADKVAVKVVSRYRREPREDILAEGLGAAIEAAERPQYATRDEVTVELAELGGGGHSGRFGGSVRLVPVRPGQPVDKTDHLLTAAPGDQVVATYVDELHIQGRVPRQVTARIEVIGEIDGRPRATQNVVPDPILKSKKLLVEATAYLELARIFRSMGLMKGAKAKAAEGLARVDTVVRLRSPVPSSLREEAFRLKWELYIVQDDFRNAMATCRLFNRLYPDSPFVDQALMGIGRIRMENKEYQEAIRVFRQILSLPHSQAKAEAQFLIAQATEAMGPERREAAIAQYKVCADRYPESAYAGRALAKLVDYYVESRDYARADDLLGQIFQDYPDGDFLDSMLLKWVIVAFRMGNYQKAHEKCSQLIFEYPASEHAKKAKEILPRIESRLKTLKETATKKGKGE